LGLTLGDRLPQRFQDTLLNGIGLMSLIIGVQMTLKTQNILIMLGSIVIGGIIGEFLQIKERLDQLGYLLQQLFAKGDGKGRFSEGFITASLVFCVGPMTIMGSIQDGLTGDYQLLAIKSMLDGFAAIAFAAGLGWGVMVAAGTVLTFQGALTLSAGILNHLLTEPMIAEMTASSGLMIVGIGLLLLGIKEIKVANYLPALIIAPMLVALSKAF